MLNLLDDREFVCWILNEDGFWEQMTFPIGVLYMYEDFNRGAIQQLRSTEPTASTQGISPTAEDNIEI